VILRAGVVVVLAALAALVGAAGAAAQTYTNACPDMPPDLESATDDAIETREQGQRDVTICLAVTERLEALVALQAAAVEDDATTAAQRVALAPVDRNRLDLSWFGVWAVVGTLWVLLIAPLFVRAFRFWRE